MKGPPVVAERRDPVARSSTPTLTPQVSGTVNRLDSVAAVNARVVWASGRGGTVVRTIDGGETWEAHVIPGAETLALRDVEAVSQDVAFVMSNNGGPNARIYKTEDGGRTWTLQFQSPIANTFYDCFALWTPQSGVAIPDAEDGRFDVVRMTDGQTWENIGDLFPPGQPGEGLFPASGTCVTTRGGRLAWAVTGGGAQARVIATTDRGDTWNSYPIPMGGTASSGGLSIQFRDNHRGILGGGEVAAPTVQQDNFARSRDGGKTWALATPAPFPGPIYGLGYATHGGGETGGSDDDSESEGAGHHLTIVATGVGGTAWSPDEGDTWEALAVGTPGFVSVSFGDQRTGWLVGTSGRVLRIDFPD
ncbi:MAG TPA: hypothetical protein VFD38_02320 [Myxococcaceae bacterium]|nr:hypothetical protein [Myxococcaceae bacterium]